MTEPTLEIKVKTPKLADYPPVYRELYAMHEFFRRLGFPSDNLNVLMDRENNVGYVLSWKGQEHTIRLGKIIGITQPEFFAVWGEIIELINGGTIEEEELQDAWYGSVIFQRKEEVMQNMIARGLHPVKGLN